MNQKSYFEVFVMIRLRIESSSNDIRDIDCSLYFVFASGSLFPHLSGPSRRSSGQLTTEGPRVR